MSSSYTARHSGSPSRHGIETAQGEIESYECNYFKLSKLFRKHRVSLHKHSDLCQNVRNTKTQTIGTLKAEQLVNKYKSRPAIFSFKKSSDLKKYENLKREMEENNSKVERLIQQINGIIESHPERVGAHTFFNTDDPLMDETIPITQPYDEGLCEF
ncbi:hypothetical protein LCI18_002012 [Fusarium solani-melongenae]|uniref:Uncharacterized protein n=1 Tax=Fusarium solani subsp. cucurbitae TaxID=2747967 RepID=A0ACD3YQ31_FUSSC|nr:hypothetical protein LCI18_002012 [Fusarium solani-melongenae]